MKRFGLLLAVVAVLMYAGAARAADAPKPVVHEGAVVSITINPTDATKATLVVGKEKPATIAVDSTTKIRKDEKDAKLADLKVGDIVRVVMAGEVAKTVVVRAPKAPAAGNTESGKKSPKAQGGETLKGLLVSITVDPADSTKATLVVGKEKPTTVTANASTKIQRNGKEAKLSDLQAGDLLTSVKVTNGVATAITAKAAKAPAAPKS